MRMKGVGGGEIVQVQGGHIVRSTGRKDRHSKVYTAKGPRDRRVRLSAHTAIQFYDVQDRLGYDRPSKAVDWLIKKAKSAIDKLAELPSWHPTGNSDQDADPETDPNVSVSGEMGIGSEEQSGYGFQLQRAEMSAGENTDFIADTMKSFFPTTTSVAANSSMNFQNYPQDNLPTQDLGLSLHCFQEQGGADHAPPSEQAMFGSVVGFGSSGYQRMVAWNGHDQASGGESRGFAFQAPPPQLTAAHQQALLGQGSAATPFSNQRGTLQSSFSTPLARDWDDLPSIAVAAAAVSQRPQQQHIHQHSSSSSSSIFGTRSSPTEAVYRCSVFRRESTARRTADTASFRRGRRRLPLRILLTIERTKKERKRKEKPESFRSPVEKKFQNRRRGEFSQFNGLRKGRNISSLRIVQDLFFFPN